MRVIISQTIEVDDEIAWEIVWLNSVGVHTIASCAGHGYYPSTALIKPSSAKRAHRLGYIPVYDIEQGTFSIMLHGQSGGEHEESHNERCVLAAIDGSLELDLWRYAMSRLGKNLASLRKERGLSQEQVADGSNLSRNIISRIEQGENNPTLKTLLALARFFDVNIECLTDGEE